MGWSCPTVGPWLMMAIRYTWERDMTGERDMTPGTWYAVTPDGSWIDMGAARLVCVPALSDADRMTFDLAAARPVGGSELVSFAARHGVSFRDLLMRVGI